jgi:N-acetylmuramoyl-L-alanine amidase
MFGSRFRMPLGLRTVVAWMGLLLMAASVGWLQWSSESTTPTPAIAPATQEPFAVVVLDPGHGGQDSGAMCGGMLEKDLTLDVAQRIDRLLQAHGLATIMTRIGDGYVSPAERVALTSRVPDCIFVSIHFNEGNKPVSSGIETYYAERQLPSGKPIVSWLPFLQRTALEAPNPESQSLAGFIQEALVAHTQAVNRGAKAEQFFVIANVRQPAVLVEGGFLTNKEDMTRLGNADYREQIAGGISDGIIHYRDLLKQRQATLAVTATERGE